MKLLAIDPGSKRLGTAIFDGSTLIKLKTYYADGPDSNKRIFKLIGEFALEAPDVSIVCIEDAIIRGSANNMIQKVIGSMMGAYHRVAYFNFYRPTQVKKAMGSGTLDKLEVALSVGSYLKTVPEKELIADAVSRDDWDATDAAAIGLTYLKGIK